MRRGARPAHRAARALALASAALLLTGCAQSVDPIERLGKKAAQTVRHSARPLSVRTGTRAVDHVATTDRVVFLTYDEEAVRDRRLATLIGELHLPVTVFTHAEAPAHWRARTTRHGLAYRGTPEHLTPGDIIRITPDGEGGLAGRTARVLKEARERGLTPGKLTDYL
ncbi:hypothetical protein E5083_01170 [Streptomyces bauhiniae]|uniref:Polysaccharide deacetylase family protein n=1 Tax=Streptomyces bauhiniae TaxID=2340725 RepID=A0A4Z1DF88_9ACTN|nr:hypothetical protein [Streptomyces bauhiniae]TGN81171.1 hypothetical protein E5083_01170 [Streptomyces bauhiniae]